MKRRTWSSVLTFVMSIWSLGEQRVNGEQPVPIPGICKALLGQLGRCWELVRCDEKPTIEIAKNKGYRILLRSSYRQYPVRQQDTTPYSEEELRTLEFVMLYSHIDLVLFPDSGQCSEQTKNEIPWLNVEQEHYTRAVYWGTGKGYAWFGRSTLGDQNHLRTRLGLVGGEDRLDLLIEGLRIEDKGNYTANTCFYTLQRVGEKAIPYLERALKENPARDPYRTVQVLAGMSGTKATDVLEGWYASSVEGLSRAAAYALAQRPFRESSKPIYIDMMRKRICPVYAANACVAFSWTDAMPLLEEICAKPVDWREFEGLFKATRKLKGKPVPKDILDAQAVLIKADYHQNAPSPEAIAEAKAKILGATDKEAAMVAALSLVLMTSKGGAPKVNQIGRDILEHLPTEVTRPMIDRLKANLKDDWMKRKLPELP